MIAFLTSIPGGTILDEQRPRRFHEENGFLERLSAVWPRDARCVMVCAEPDNIEENDEMRRNYLGNFALSGLSAAKLSLVDSRNPDELDELLADCDVLVLSGGHTLMQNRFFRRIGLKERMGKFDGLLLCISGGSMNCAREVYAQPEYEGDTTDPTYDRFPEGLGLTDIRILPHYQVVRESTLDGLRLLEDVAFPDSMGRTIHGLPDGSYVLLQDGKEEIYGEYFLIRDGVVRRMQDR